MQSAIACPKCGESEELTGSPSPDGIRIRCGRCDAEWLRDSATQMCATCGGNELEARSRALTQFSRGTQLSIVVSDSRGAVRIEP
jgi:predicted nucleic-acid-binding Zn-ribbon protein